MTRFSEITYDEEIETAVVGAGLLWNEVYAPLDPLGGGVVGGRAPGIWRCWVHTGWRVLVDTNERGLALDNVVGFELVKPDGGVALVSDKSDPNLFFVLKLLRKRYRFEGIFYCTTPGIQYSPALTALLSREYSESAFDKDRGSIERAYRGPANRRPYRLICHPMRQGILRPRGGVGSYLSINSELYPTLFVAYNGPTPPDAIFDNFLAMPMLESNISTRDGVLPLIKSAANNASDCTGIDHSS
ncbi:uncharacterized protein SCHCODRAFT_01161073 [Schizophyllum commune H4-8]|nr:uncharacterized protein SCHCODRAFT_01161073 [Schizophyllum commune H4-8]KAI5886835.1 hypothetical protein SCHCODRAFT_01161073 [Schizophyllum commune H4-8]